MLVDDDEAVRFFIKRILTGGGMDCDIVEAQDGEEALRKIRDRREESDDDSALPSVIILDINMPRMNGIEFLEAFADLRNDDDSFDLTNVVMVTSSGEPVDREQTMCHDFVKGYVEKMPSDRDDFVGLISELAAE